MKKKNIFCKIIILFVLALVFSCSQDPIFFTISTEPRPVKPRIPGGPTNMVVFNGRMYVASGKLFSYNNGWDDSLQPGDKVIGLASTGSHLYALCLTGSGVKTVLRRKEPTGGWADIGSAESKYTLIQSIYADNGELFAGAMNDKGSDYGILYLDGGTLRLIAGDTEMLSGAASRTELSETVYFLSTKGRGVYTIIDEGSGLANKTATHLGGSESKLLMGMVKLKDDSTPSKEAIIVIERDGGTFYEVRKDGFRTLKYTGGAPVTSAIGKFATGALAEWVNVENESQKMLIAGIQGGLFSTSTTSSYSHGYVEIELDSPFNIVDGWLVLINNRSTNPDITVGGNTDRYTATIGKHPVNHFFQTPVEIDPNRIFFASTQTAGLWSYRYRDGGWQWNAEN
ncbi:MAG: hypothetical protein LBC52_04780 [Treponema sp.]|jgi:hypothetical protein|nr:hypothetical protein [Treponema sp.]